MTPAASGRVVSALAPSPGESPRVRSTTAAATITNTPTAAAAILVHAGRGARVGFVIRVGPLATDRADAAKGAAEGDGSLIGSSVTGTPSACSTACSMRPNASAVVGRSWGCFDIAEASASKNDRGASDSSSSGTGDEAIRT